jgi:hypothetical protein
MVNSLQFSHPTFSRRFALQAGCVGLLGLGVNHLSSLHNAHATESRPAPGPKSRACIFIFLSGGFAQHDTFDMKPDAPDNIRGEFSPISTATPDLLISEHLPLLAKRSEKWSLIRSLTHPQNSHLHAHMMMLSGRTELPPAFDPNKSQPSDWPSIVSLGGEALRQYAALPVNNLPPAVMLPEGLRASPTQYLPGQGAGEMGTRRDPWEFALSPFVASEAGAPIRPTHFIIIPRRRCKKMPRSTRPTSHCPKASAERGLPIASICCRTLKASAAIWSARLRAKISTSPAKVRSRCSPILKSAGLWTRRKPTSKFKKGTVRTVSAGPCWSQSAWSNAAWV